MKYLEYAAPIGFAVMTLFCIVYLQWNAIFSAILGAGVAAGIAYVQNGGLSKKPEDKAAAGAAPSAAAAGEKKESAPKKPEETKEGEKPVFKEGEEPEHFHDNDELAAKAGVFRDKARKLRDEAFQTEGISKERKSQLIEEADAEDAKASKMIFEELQKKQPEGTIDLHLQFVAEAVRICEEQAEILKGKGHQEMIVITGKGNHSEGGKCKIAPAIEQWANEHGYSQEPGEGKITVKF